jgi:hypothetical protein
LFLLVLDDALLLTSVETIVLSTIICNTNNTQNNK